MILPITIKLGEKVMNVKNAIELSELTRYQGS